MVLRALAGLLLVGFLINPAVAGQPQLRGVNLAGAEFAADKLPGKAFTDYMYPSTEDLRAIRALSMNTIRLPFLWERLQPELMAPLDPAELGRIDAVVTDAGALGLTVILDPHDYGKYRGALIGSPSVPSSAFQAFWRQLARHYIGNSHVAFGLMNEPVKQSAIEWAAIARGALNAIRATGAKQLVLVPGTNWTGAHSWQQKTGGASNAEALADLRDPANNMAIELHQYFDSDASGTHAECAGSDIGREALAGVTAWLRQTHHRGFLGEFGGTASQTCLAALDGTLAHMNDNADVWLGWTYWAAGDWFGDYMYRIDPEAPGKYPQLALLRKYLADGSH